MAELHEALKSLAPVEWDDVPKDNLHEYVKDLVKACDIICGSVPPPEEVTPVEDLPTEPPIPQPAQSAADTGPCSIRAPPPHSEHETLQSSWGKPIKFSAKENPLKVAVYKMAGRDRHGSWFARRSVHEGIGFNKFRTAMLREFPQTLTVQGAPGAGSIRGIGGDQRLERIDVDAESRLEVFQLSAQFPGPTTPREFITMLVTDQHPTTYSTSQQGRQLMIISKPVDHSAAPERSGYIRGQYESVELIREIPVDRKASQSTHSLPTAVTAEASHSLKLHRSRTDLKDVSSSQRDDMDHADAESNPVEWIMITRSDPGGGIPRFMVDRGTPSAMLSDINKLLNWAVTIDENEDPDVDLKQPPTVQPATTQSPANSETAAAALPPQQHVSINATSADSMEKAPGVFEHLTSALEASLEAYAPAMVSSFVHERLHHHDSTLSSSDSSVISSTGSFASAADTRHPNDPAADEKSVRSGTASLQSELKDDGIVGANAKDKQLLKELQKIQEAQDKLEQRLAKKREEENEKLKKSQDEEQSESSKALERHDKDIKKQEEQHQKELAKLQAKRERELKKYEERKRKQNDRDALQKVARERDSFRTQVDLLKRENAVLRERIEHFEQADDTK